MNQDWSLRHRAVIVAAAVASACFLWLTGDKSVENLIPIVLAAGAAGAVAWLSPSKPVAAFGILFLVASLSGFIVSTRLGNMRLEQPAIVAGYAALLLAPSRVDLRRLRPMWPIGAAFGLYLVCLTLSSILFSVNHVDSLRMTFWTGLSIAGGVLALLLLARGNARATDWVLASGHLQAVVGIVCAVLFFTLGPVILAGPQAAPGVSQAVSSTPKVFALSWEANIYASFLAAVAILGLNRLLSGDRSRRSWLLPVLIGAIALGLTRGAYLGLAAGVGVYALFAVAGRRSWALQAMRRVAIRGAVVAGSLLVGVAVAAVLMQGGRPPTKPLDLTQPWFGRGQVAAGQPGVTPTYTVKPPPDTVTFRMDRIPVALADIPNSLVIGLGADSFGQRHADPSQAGAPDHIAILALAALYESGALGAAGLGMGFALVLLALFRASRRRADRGQMAAYAGALACLLVAYEATNALNFALIWLLAGAALASTVVVSTAENPGVAAPG